MDVGTAIGSLPKGVSQTSIQDDFDRELTRLKLEKFKNRRAAGTRPRPAGKPPRQKSKEAAFLDLHRSSFLHRLAVLEVGFAQEAVRATRRATTWAESWALQWTPEAEIAIVEAVLLGETIELATAFKFKQRLENCTSIADAAALIRDACECGMSGSIELARQTLQRAGQ